jgi:thioesterase domain-containing protein
MIAEFRISAGHTLALPPKQPTKDTGPVAQWTKIEASINVVVNDGDDYNNVKAQAQKELRLLLEETFRAQQQKAKE